jgi:hypothetical protein
MLEIHTGSNIKDFIKKHIDEIPNSKKQKEVVYNNSDFYVIEDDRIETYFHSLKDLETPVIVWNYSGWKYDRDYNNKFRILYPPFEIDVSESWRPNNPRIIHHNPH